MQHQNFQQKNLKTTMSGNNKKTSNLTYFDCLDPPDALVTLYNMYHLDASSAQIRYPFLLQQTSFYGLSKIYHWSLTIENQRVTAPADLSSQKAEKMITHFMIYLNKKHSLLKFTLQLKV